MNQVQGRVFRSVTRAYSFNTSCFLALTADRQTLLQTVIDHSSLYTRTCSLGITRSDKRGINTQQFRHICVHLGIFPLLSSLDVSSESLIFTAKYLKILSSFRYVINADKYGLLRSNGQEQRPQKWREASGGLWLPSLEHLLTVPQGGSNSRFSLKVPVYSLA